MLAARLLSANVRLSQRTQRRLNLPTDKVLWDSFGREVQERFRQLPDGARIVDLGGGRRCVYHHGLRPELELVAVDVSAEELALNEHASATILADVCEGLPLPDASVDLLVSRAVLEHVADLPAAVSNMARVLKPGAATLHLLPGRYSLFAIAARVLPFRPLLWLLHRVRPSTIGQVEFDVHYHRGTPAGIQRAFREAGFKDVSVEITWASPGYFEAVYPLFLLYAVYEFIVRRLRLSAFAAYMVVRAVR